ncbi:MAG: 4Fe-4S binding protein [Thermotogae bacterium]|nr:4Fe-4S binding protein [Thermotogota bacterium]
MAELKGWKDIPIGGLITEPGSSKKFNTGGWRVMRPIYDRSKCIDCMMCWIVCPDMAIIQEDGIMKAIDYDYCKGCGICASVCPRNAIEMKPETEFQE